MWKVVGPDHFRKAGFSGQNKVKNSISMLGNFTFLYEKELTFCAFKSYIILFLL